MGQIASVLYKFVIIYYIVDSDVLYYHNQHDSNVGNKRKKKLSLVGKLLLTIKQAAYMVMNRIPYNHREEHC